MAKKIILLISIIALVVLFGTWPLSILGKVFELIAVALKWLAKTLDFFGCNGII